MAKILIADDVESERRLVQSVLEDAGHNVIAVEDGKRALEVIDDVDPDLVVLDVVMPGKSGFDVCRAIRKSDDFGKTPVILLTSKDQESDKFWGEKQGASQYLTKPFEPAALVAAVARFA